MSKTTKEKRKEYAKDYYEKNKHAVIERVKRYRKEKREKYLKARRARKIKRWSTDDQYRLRELYRHKIYLVLSGKCSGKKIERLIGCSVSNLKNHFESMFKTGMSWENYGEWHVDHKRPLILFDLKKEAELLSAFHFSNLQPLWAHENRKKWTSIQED